MTLHTFAIDRSAGGSPIIWEEGGGAKTKGKAIVIASSTGARLKRVETKTRGGEAAFAVSPGTHIIVVHRRHTVAVFVYVVRQIGEYSCMAECLGEWLDDVPPELGHLADAAAAAIGKSRDTKRRAWYAG